METNIDEPPSQVLSALLEQNYLGFYVLIILVLLVLLGLSALISGSEVAFFSMSPNDVDQSKKKEKKKDQSLVFLLSNPKKLLATILILNNLINVAIITLATYLSINIVLETGVNKFFGIISTLSLISLITSLSIIFFGEVIPKVYATQNSLKFARMVGPSLKVAQTILQPISWLLLKLSNIIESRFENKGYDVSLEELNHALDITTQSSETTEDEKEILKGIVNFGSLSVKQIMKSRMDIVAFDSTMDFHELMNKINKSGFSRVPIYEETIDKIKGILYIKDLLPHLEKEEKFEWNALVRPPLYVPETKKIDTLLKDFQLKHIHLAIVVDEYGGTSGLITLEDIIEEIVGEIRDEFDDDDIDFKQLDTSTYIFEGKTSLHDFCKMIEVDSNLFEEVKGESESLGGLLLELNAAMPRIGEKLIFDQFEFTAVALDKKRIKKVKVHIKNEAKAI